MKIRNLSYAVAAALSLGAGSAFALPLSQYNAADTLDVYVSGSSAQDGSLELYVDSVCKPGTLDIYRASNQRMMFCQIDGSTVSGFPAAPAFQKVLIHKSSAGGSGEGVQPVADQIALAAMSPSSTCDAGSSVTPAGGLPTYTAHSCSALVTTNQVPDAGISDEEPALFGASPSQLAKLQITSQDGVIFGIIASQNLRDALQKAQGLTVGADDEANMPNLTRQQIASMFNGGITDWTQVTDASGTPLPSVAGVTPPVNTSVYITRRVSTSGTQTGTQVYFLNQGCLASVLPALSGNDGGSCGTNTVNEGSGSGNVVSCTNTNYSLNHWSIGLLGVENKAGASDHYRFIKVNGYAPTLLNVAQSKYDFVMENSVQWRNAASGNALSGLKLNLMQAIATQNGSPTILSAVDGSIGQPWGGTGFMALITNGYVPTLNPTAAQVLANPVMTMTKSPAGSPNNCQPPVIYFPTSVK